MEFETFRSLGAWHRGQLQSKEPSSFNGDVIIKKTKVTFEVIEESKEVYQERIQQLWDLCDNMNHAEPIKYVAKELGYELKGERGNKIKRK